MSKDINVTDGTVLETLNNKVDLDGGNYPGSGLEAYINTYHHSQITNCITEIPQRVKLELNNGVLTLKAGSAVIIPNGFEEDGVTPKFNYVMVSDNLTFSNLGTNGDFVLVATSSSTHWKLLKQCASGSSDPQTAGSFYYDVSKNLLKDYTTSGASYNVGLPIAIVNYTDGLITEIKQVFNGVGYIGSTIWVDKGVKGLIPNGRNEDGTLRNIECTLDKLFIQHEGNISYTNNSYVVTPNKFVNKYNITGSVNGWKLTDDNYLIHLGFKSAIEGFTFVNNVTMENGVITSFQPKLPFRAIDYSDKSEVSGWGMPSNKYIDLTLGASGTYYDVPADGYIEFVKAATADNQVVSINVLKEGRITISSNDDVEYGFGHFLPNYNFLWNCTPIAKGRRFRVFYDAGGDLIAFRFIYAKGSESEV